MVMAVATEDVKIHDELLVGGQDLGFCKAPGDDFDCNRRCINIDETKRGKQTKNIPDLPVN